MGNANRSMRGNKVADGPNTKILQVIQEQRYQVQHRYFLFAISLLISLAAMSMPFFAYITEVMPWQTGSGVHPAADNFAQFNSSALILSQYLYNQTTLPLGAQYFADPAHNSFVFRQVFNPTEYTNCAAMLPHFPGSIFYNPSMSEIACSLMNLNASRPERSTCILVRILTIPIAHECLWITKGNELTCTDDYNTFTVTFVLTQYLYPSLLWLKFIVRCIASKMIASCLWKNYFSHYFALAQTLRRYGHQQNLEKTVVWRYQLVVGDPIAILVTNKYIVGAFFVDQWLSPHVTAEVVLRLLEHKDIATTLAAALFLFRLIWFAYGSISMMNYILKWSRREYLFAEVDPTTLSIFALFYIPSVWLVFANVESCLHLWQWLQVCMFPKETQHEQIEVGLVGSMCVFLIGCLPVVCGVVFRICRGPRSSKRYSSFRYNSLKNRVLFSSVHPLRQSDRATTPSFGGNIYKLFNMNPAYKARPAMNARGSDCFLMCYGDDQVVAIFRLSLMSSLDDNGSHPSLAIHQHSEASMFNMNMIQIHSLTCRSSSTRYQRPIVMLYRSRIPSVWCI